jgi:hypothetical protein
VRIHPTCKQIGWKDLHPQIGQKYKGSEGRETKKKKATYRFSIISVQGSNLSEDRADKPIKLIQYQTLNGGWLGHHAKARSVKSS